MLLLGTFPGDSMSYHRDTCSSVFLIALFLIPRKWDQPECSADERIVKMWLMPNGVLLGYK